MGFLDFLSGVGTLFGEISRFIGQIFQFLWALMQQLFLFVWNNLVIVANFLVNGFRKIAQFFQRFWTDYVLKGIRGLLGLYERLRARIQAIVDPVLKLIRRIKAWYDLHVLPWQFKIINLIQRVRMTLTVFRFFHVKWAIALDNKLARIQGKIVESIQIVRGKLNEIASFFEILTNPALLARSLAGANWIVGAFDAALQTVAGFGLGNLIGRKNRYSPKSPKSAPFSYYTDAMEQETKTGTGPMSEVSSQARHTWGALDEELR